MKRIHATNDTIDLSRKYGVSGHYKPWGLWYAFETDWIDWCGDNRFKKYSKSVQIDLEVKNVCILKNHADINQFTKKYGMEADYSTFKGYFSFIDWEKVKTSYKGIEILNYGSIDVIRYSWLMGYDVSSGCIWDLSAIKSIKYD